jgi:hypothetical protein
MLYIFDKIPLMFLLEIFQRELNEAREGKGRGKGVRSEGCWLYKNLYNHVMAKQIEFISDSLSELRMFPISARREAGFQLDKVQRGLEPDD